ncbi:hypothetical protein J0818_28280 [Bacillus cereus]|uniref:Uncharacterized protein n=1 Tax=Bacillus mobilis TaxID=2026190 RepID=A0A1Y5ZMM1_9BACI|nr:MULTISPECIES: hypothetical protein [Bacillus cereus group]MBL3742367.1 hypothetical protein [Bacillus cereus]MBL3865020.1 hypothetical protein [Bacillus cereus]SME05232.1 hypothetical protein BACERE00185_02414 [Bacillus mobilis]
MTDIIEPIYNLTGISPTLNSMFDRLQVSDLTPLFNYGSNYVISALRDIVTTIGNGAVTNTGGYYQLKPHRYKKKTVFDIMCVIYEYNGFGKQKKVA